MLIFLHKASTYVQLTFKDPCKNMNFFFLILNFAGKNYGIRKIKASYKIQFLI